MMPITRERLSKVKRVMRGGMRGQPFFFHQFRPGKWKSARRVRTGRMWTLDDLVTR